MPGLGGRGEEETCFSQVSRRYVAGWNVDVDSWERGGGGGGKPRGYEGLADREEKRSNCRYRDGARYHACKYSEPSPCASYVGSEATRVLR